jgi:hypothetical protein
MSTKENAMITVGECPCGRIGTLDNGRCVACRLDAAIAANPPRNASFQQVFSRPLTVAELMGRLVAELEADEVIDPLAQSFTLAGIWSDLARLAGEPLPHAAAAIVGATLDTPVDLRYLRGPAADEARTWPESTAAAYLPAYLPAD